MNTINRDRGSTSGRPTSYVMGGYFSDLSNQPMTMKKGSGYVSTTPLGKKKIGGGKRTKNRK